MAKAKPSTGPTCETRLIIKYTLTECCQNEIQKKKKQYPDQPNEIIGPLIEETNELIRLLKQINLYKLI